MADDTTTVTYTFNFEDITPEAFRKAKEQIAASIARGLTRATEKGK